MMATNRGAAVRRVLWIVLLLNLAITITKLVVGLNSGALAVVADAFHSLVDSSANVIGLVGVWVAARPADQNHPYGHRKYETIATLSIGALLLVAAFEISRSVVERLLGTFIRPNITPPAIIVMIITLAVNFGLSVYEAREGRRLMSSLLRADAVHTRTDLYVTLSVIVSLLGARYGFVWLDSVVAAAVALLLFRAAFVILRSSSQELSDVAVADPAAVQDAARAVPGVSDVSSVRSRGTEEAKYIDLHIKVNPAMDADQAHGVATEVERRIAAALPGVVDTVVHVEPVRLDGLVSDWEALALKLRGVADGMGLSLHDLHAHLERDGRVSVELHLELPANLTLREAHGLADRFEARAREILPQVRSLVTHLEPLPARLDDEAGRLSPARLAALRKRLTEIADHLAGPGACHNVELHDLGGHLTATLHVTQPADMPLTEAHALAEAIERQLHASVGQLNRVVVHVEPPRADRI